MRRPPRMQVGSDPRQRLRGRPKGQKQDDAEELPIEKSCEIIQVIDSWPDERTTSVDQVLVFLAKLRNSVKRCTSVVKSDETVFLPVIYRINAYLWNDDYRIRTNAFKLFRLLLVNETRFRIYLKFMVDSFAIRSLDLTHVPECERIEAFRLIAALLNAFHDSSLKPDLLSRHQPADLQHTEFPRNIIKAIQATIFKYKRSAQDDFDSIPLLVRSALGLLLQLAIKDPLLVIDTIGSHWIPRILSNPALNKPQICLLMSRMLNYWLDNAEVRKLGGLKFIVEQIFAPLMDLGFFQQPDPKVYGPIQNQLYIQHVNETLLACANVFKEILKSWSGFFSIANPSDNVSSSPISILSYLGHTQILPGSNLAKLCDTIVDICCDFVNMPYAKKTFGTWNEALQFYSQMYQPDMYECSIRESFVIGEMKSILASGHTSSNDVDPLLAYRALATYVLIYNGIGKTMSRLISQNPNEPTMIKATLLLSDLFRTSAHFLPKHWKMAVLSTPVLINEMTRTLLRCHEQEGQPPQGSGVLLHRLDMLSVVAQARANGDPLANMNYINLLVRARTIVPAIVQEKNINDLELACFDAISDSLADSADRWRTVSRLIATFYGCPLLLERLKHNEKCHMFFLQLLDYFAPKNEKVLSDELTDRYAVFRTGASLAKIVAHLAQTESYYQEMLDNYISDFCHELDAANVPDAVLSFRNVLHTQVILYFAIVSALGSHPHGHRSLEKSGYYQTCHQIITNGPVVEYTKLILSSLNYKHSVCRKLLEIALTATVEPCRKWATRFLEVLLALDQRGQMEDFVLDLLLQQLADPVVKVRRIAVNVLTKWLPKYPDSFSRLQRIDLRCLGEAGALLEACAMSGEQFVKDNHKQAVDALAMWMTSFNRRYVQILEDEMRLAVGFPKRSLNGTFARQSNDDRSADNLRLPHHLLSSLSQHGTGRQILADHKVIGSLLEKLRMSDNVDELDMKATLLGLGFIIGNLDDDYATQHISHDTFSHLTRQAEQSPCLSVRGVAFWSVCLAARSAFGIRHLADLNWATNRRQDLQDEVEAQKRRDHFGDDTDLDSLAAQVKPWGHSDSREQHKLSTEIGKANGDVLKKSGRKTEHSMKDAEQNDRKTSSRSEKLRTLNPDLEPCMRSTRSNSMYMRAGNEALTALRTRKFSRRTSTGNSVSTSVPNLNPVPAGGSVSDLDDDTVEDDVLEIDELNLHVELSKAMDREGRHDYTKPRSASTNVAAFLTPDYTETVKFVRTRNLPPNANTDHIWIMSDGEKDAVRRFRQIMDGQRQLSPPTTPRNFQRFLGERIRQQSEENAWPVVALPNEVRKVLENIFTTPTTNTQKPSNPSKEVTFERAESETLPHDKTRCYYCLQKRTGEDVFGFADCIDESMNQVYAEKRDEILNAFSMLELQEGVYQTTLANYYKDTPHLFAHPCLHSDLLNMLTDLNYSANCRAFLQSLFWGVFPRQNWHVEPRNPTPQSPKQFDIGGDESESDDD